MIVRLIARLRGLARRRTIDAELDEELQFHLAHEIDANTARGMTPAEARRVALRDLGGITQTKEAVGDVRTLSLDLIWRDMRHAVRALRAAPGFTVIALIILTLGIGASTAIFSVVDAVVLRGLPFDEHDRLVAVGERRLPRPGDINRTPPADPAAVSSSAPQNYADWAKQQQVFESMAAIAGGAFTLREAGAEPEEVRAQRVTADFFKVLREQPVLGRTFTAENEVEGNHRIVILSDGLWRRRFNADPAIVGRSIPLEGGSYEVIGVMAPDFAYPVGSVRPTEMWTPYVVPADERIRNPNSVSIYLSTIARLKPGV